MAVRQYIGARYVPTFEGAYDAEKVYEPLSIVTYLNSSYTSRKEVPAGTLPTNSEYWALTGSFNAQVEEYRQEVEAVSETVSKIPKRRKFILIGDSYGYGVIGGGAARATGWIPYTKNLYGSFADFYDIESLDEYEGVMAFTGRLPWLNLLQTIERNKLDCLNEEITDIVVLGGSNELTYGGGTYDTIKQAVGDFCAYAHSTFPNAKIKIGCLALIANKLYNGGVYAAYKDGCKLYGAEFIEDLLNLLTDPSTDSGYGHITAAGYNKYNPYIAYAVLHGKVKFMFEFDVPLTLNENLYEYDGGSYTFVLNVKVTNDSVSFKIMDAERYTSFIIKHKTKTANTFSGVAFNVTTDCHVAYPNRGYGSLHAYIRETNGHVYSPVKNGHFLITADNYKISAVTVAEGFCFYKTWDAITSDSNYLFTVWDDVDIFIPFVK